MSAIEHVHDQEVVLTDEETGLLGQVDDILAAAREASDPFVAFGAGRQLRRSLQVGGVALARLLYGIAKDHYFNRGDQFVDDVEVEMGLAPQTTRKYVAMYEWVLVDRPELMSKPIGGLLLLTAAAREGDLTDDDWKAVEQAPDKSTIREIVRSARGINTSGATALVIVVGRDGVLRAKRGNGAYVTGVGFLNRNPGSEEASAAVERIIRAAGIVEV